MRRLRHLQLVGDTMIRAPLRPLSFLLLAAALAGACHRDHGGDTDLGDGGDPFGDGGLLACATQSAQGQLAPLDLLLILDTSASMDYLGKWSSVKQAVRAFVNNPAAAGLGLGLQYYPLRAQCNRDDYAAPAVPIQVLPMGATEIGDSLTVQQMSGGTPMVAAMEGALRYLKQFAADNPTHKVALILASDGAPDDSCIAPSAMGRANSLDNATLTAMEAFAADPKVSTFVIGVGSETPVLEQIATAGGGKAFFVDTNSDVQGAFLKALQDIRGDALSCELPIPDASGQVLDYDRVNVLFTPTGATSPSAFIYVQDKGNCAQATANGWYYDDPANPTKVVLCPEACSLAATSASGRIDVVFGCQTVIL
jgi:hypothetical protein